MNSIRLDAPLVSIIVNNYNYAKFLTTAIESALNQTYGNIEVIVVDDGSTDDSRAVIGAFGSRIKSVFQKNGGQGSAYNAGFAASKGELIHYLDADDILMPSAIQRAVDVWEQGVCKVQFYLAVIEGDHSLLSNSSVPSARLDSGDLLPMLLEHGNYISPPATGNLYSRAALERILPMPPESWLSHADLYCIFGVPFFGEVRSIREALGFYRVHGNNIDAQTKVSGPLLRYRLTKEEKRDALLKSRFSDLGIDYKNGTVTKGFSNLKLRFASVVIDPSGHPYPQETKSLLFRRIIAAVCKDSSSSFVKKLLFISWATALVTTRGFVRETVSAMGFVQISRPRVIQHLLSFAGSK